MMHVYKRKSANLPLSVLNISVKTALCFIITVKRMKTRLLKHSSRQVFKY